MSVVSRLRNMVSERHLGDSFCCLTGMLNFLGFGWVHWWLKVSSGLVRACGRKPSSWGSSLYLEQGMPLQKSLSSCGEHPHFAVSVVRPLKQNPQTSAPKQFPRPACSRSRVCKLQSADPISPWAKNVFYGTCKLYIQISVSIKGVLLEHSCHQHFLKCCPGPLSCHRRIEWPRPGHCVTHHVENIHSLSLL